MRHGKLCLVVKAENITSAIDLITQYREVVDLFEIRVDFLESLTNILELRRFRDRLIVTIRRKEEGGFFRGSETDRLNLYCKFLKISPRYVDVEIRSQIACEVISRAKKAGSEVIVSHHDFNQTPPLERIIKMESDAKKMGADIFKIVTKALKVIDNITILQFLSRAKMPVIGFCIGEIGIISRILAPYFGSIITYVAVSEKERVAPGQLTLDEINQIWRFLDDKWKN